MAVTVNITSKKPDGKKITRALNYRNPAVTDAAITAFICAFANLSDNVLKHLEKDVKTDLNIPED